MSMTLGDVDELSTDSDDEEYIPEGGGVSSEEEEHDELPEDGKSGATSTGGATKAGRRPNRARSRKRKEKLKTDKGKKEEEEDEEEKKVQEKARIDQLWASFKQDTAIKPSDTKGKESAEPPKKRLKIQKTYDFAGEEIVVEKEVSADSKEAKQYLQSCAESAIIKSSEHSTSPGGSVVRTPSISIASMGTQSSRGSISQTQAGSAKRGSGLGAVLKTLGKKNKMSTLEKSSIDWDQYKHKHELEEELAHSTKDGYLAKQEFLQWSDHKQFERERNERLKRFKKLH